jgi:hypothetical protein
MNCRHGAQAHADPAQHHAYNTTRLSSHQVCWQNSHQPGQNMLWSLQAASHLNNRVAVAIQHPYEVHNVPASKHYMMSLNTLFRQLRAIQKLTASLAAISRCRSACKCLPHSLLKSCCCVLNHPYRAASTCMIITNTGTRTRQHM